MFGNVAYNILQFIPLKARPLLRSKKGPRLVPCRWEATAPCRKLRFRDWRLRGASRSCCTEFWKWNVQQGSEMAKFASTKKWWDSEDEIHHVLIFYIYNIYIYAYIYIQFVLCTRVDVSGWLVCGAILDQGSHRADKWHIPSFFSNKTGGENKGPGMSRSRRDKSEFAKKAAPPPEKSDPGGRSNPVGEDYPPSSSIKAKGWCLGATSGSVAAGAWAARSEIANMLEMRCDPSTLIELIRSGEEGTQALSADGRLILGLKNINRSRVDLTSESPRTKGSDDVLSLLTEGEDLNEVVHGQMAIMESLKNKMDETPPWVAHSDPKEALQDSIAETGRSDVPPWLVGGDRSRSGLALGSERNVFGEDHGKDASFSKRAQAPPRSTRPHPPEPKRQKVQPESEEEKEQFAKRCQPLPKENVEVDEEEVRRLRRGRGRVGDGTSLAERESHEMERFCSEAFAIFDKMNFLGVKMDLVGIIEKEGHVDKERFLFHTAPSRASTGLNYTNVVKGLTNWISKFSVPEVKANLHPFEILRVVEYLEYLIQGGIGRNTPKTLLFGLDFFGKVFGFDPTGTAWQRSKRLANRYAKAKPGLTNRAPQFCRATLLALEKIVLDDTLDKTERISAGKLRLCCQASIRYDDMLNTPLSCLEWIRRRGELAIVGIRARSSRGKMIARPWVASLMGVEESNDRWLAVLVEMVVASHGRKWIDDDHFGKEIDRSGKFFTGRPAKMEVDVQSVKKALFKYIGEGQEVGMCKAEVELLRWHGAKATFTTLMQHLEVGPKTVRLAGDWSSKEGAMPDIYLREAQLIVMKGQEACLSHLRAGGDLSGFIAVGSAGNPPVFGNEDGADVASAPKVEKPGVSRADPIPFDGVHASGVLDHFLDEAFDTDGIAKFDQVHEEKNVIVDEGSVVSLLEDGPGELDMCVMYSFDGGTRVVKSEPTEASEEKAHGVADLELNEANEEPPDDEAADSPLDDDDGDFEGLVEFFVMASAATHHSKLHLAAHGLVDKKGRRSAVAMPMCGSKGTFDYIGGGEARDPATEPCLRCFGKRGGDCTKLCSFSVDVLGSRFYCTRRCVSPDCGASGAHLCHIHGRFWSGGERLKRRNLVWASLHVVLWVCMQSTWVSSPIFDGVSSWQGRCLLVTWVSSRAS